jgi:superfamily II DNA/RNA helicase
LQTSRGIDADKVDLVVNLDLPWDHETYLHRIGRAGRFGAFGAAVSFVVKGKESTRLREIQEKCRTNIQPLPGNVEYYITVARNGGRHIECPLHWDDMSPEAHISYRKSIIMNYGL